MGETKQKGFHEGRAQGMVGQGRWGTIFSKPVRMGGAGQGQSITCRKEQICLVSSKRLSSPWCRERVMATLSHSLTVWELPW